MTDGKRALMPLFVALVASLLCFCTPLPALAEDSGDGSAAYEVWTGYKDGSVTKFNLYKKVVEDLAYRWFMADDLGRSKVPLQSTAIGSYKQLSQYVEDYGTPTEQWEAFYADFHTSFLVRMYSLVTYEDSLATWSVSDNYAYQHFKEWYQWFEGDYSADPDQRMVTIPVEPWGAGSGNYNVPQLSYVKMPASAYESIVDFATEHGQLVTVQVCRSGSDSYTVRVMTYPSDAVLWLDRDINTGRMYVCQYTQAFSTMMYYDTETYAGIEDSVLTLDETTAYVDNIPAVIDGYYPILWRNVNVTSEVPQEPSDPIVPEPVTPENPTIDNPVYIDNDTTTTSTDLEPILEAIRRLNTNVMTGFSTIHQDINAWFAVVTDWLDDLYKQLKDINTWLERIFYRTGGGTVDGPDITIDGDGWWGWLSTIAGLLLGDLAGAVSGLAGAFDVLRTLFPFSIPWDLAGLLGLFVSEPVTPVFDLPVPFGYVNGSLESASVHVDLSAWDGVMAAVRSVELAIFALGLALKTRELLKNAEVE